MTPFAVTPLKIRIIRDKKLYSLEVAHAIQFFLYSYMIRGHYDVIIFLTDRFKRITNGAIDANLNNRPGLFLVWKLVIPSSVTATTWWRHQMETFSALLAICAGNSPVPGEFPAQRPVTRSFDVFFDLRLNKRLSKQSWGWWYETLLCPLWRHCNEICSCVR